ncbi:MAG: hypothetical protein ACFFD7_14580 [Candidatus Thorarchaeota archaeon]
MQKRTILFDINHNEMLNIEEKEFSDFSDLLRRLDLNVRKNENEKLKLELLRDADLLVIGNPIDDFFSTNEVKLVVDFVRSGGGLLLLSEYGSDYLQKTNLNDIAGKFGINFEKNLVKEVNQANKNHVSTLHLFDFIKHPITNNIREIKMGGSCALFLSKDAKPLLKANPDSWSEIFNSSTEQWIKEEEEKSQFVAAFSEFGKGKVVAIGDIDIFTSDSNFGLNSLDNQKFIQNIITWLIEPVKESKIISFILNQLGDLQFEIRESNKVLNNIIETMTILEKRISFLEENARLNSPSINLDHDGESEPQQDE